MTSQEFIKKFYNEVIIPYNTVYVDYKNMGYNSDEIVYVRKMFIKNTNILHSVNDYPAIIEYDKNMNIKIKVWYNNGKIYRENNPWIIIYDNYGNVII